MEFTPPMWMRIVCNTARGFPAVLSLPVAPVVGAAVVRCSDLAGERLRYTLGEGQAESRPRQSSGGTRSPQPSWRAAQLRREPSPTARSLRSSLHRAWVSAIGYADVVPGASHRS